MDWFDEILSNVFDGSVDALDAAADSFNADYAASVGSGAMSDIGADAIDAVYAAYPSNIFSSEGITSSGSGGSWFDKAFSAQTLKTALSQTMGGGGTGGGVLQRNNSSRVTMNNQAYSPQSVKAADARMPQGLRSVDPLGIWRDWYNRMAYIANASTATTSKVK